MESKEENKPRELDQINKEYEQLATLVGDIEAKLAILTKKKEAILRRIFELDVEAESASQRNSSAKDAE